MTFSARSLLGASLIWWLIVALVGLYWVWPLKKNINFGIDLVGGTYIGLEVQTDRALENELQTRLQPLLKQLKKNGITTTLKLDKAIAVVTFEQEQQARDAEQDFYMLSTNTMPLTIKREGAVITVTIPRDEAARIQHDAVQSNIEVLRTRLDRFGVGEIPIAPQGENRIIIELPNVDNPRQAKAMIGSSALLEFKVVEDMGTSQEEILERYDNLLPEGTIILPGKERHGGKQVYYLVPQYTEVTGKLLKDARAGYKPDGLESVVHFSFKPEGVEKFSELTGANIGKHIAIVLDNSVISAPRVKTRIDGDGYIDGDFIPEQAKELAALLKSGAFVAPVTFQEERHIGPSLGAESIRSGLLSCAIGLVLLFIFSVFAYQTAGIFAFIVLVYNLLLILLALVGLGATLTLPGIAGMVLTVGMAIDSSILIYERIRELLAVGVPMRRAVSDGFSNAMGVILDANITTFIVGAVLYRLGSGPIQGFAVTMMIGIISTLITGLFLLRSLFSFALDILGLQKIRI